MERLDALCSSGQHIPNASGRCVHCGAIDFEYLRVETVLSEARHPTISIEIKPEASFVARLRAVKPPKPPPVYIQPEPIPEDATCVLCGHKVKLKRALSGDIICLEDAACVRRIHAR